MINSNITEERLLKKNEEFSQKTEKCFSDFRGKKYNFDPETEHENFAYLKILSIDKSSEGNPAANMQSMIRKLVMSLWSLQMRLQYIVRYDGQKIDIYFGSYFDNKGSIIKLASLIKNTISGAKLETINGTEREYRFEQICGNTHRIDNYSLGFFVGNPVVKAFATTDCFVTPIDDIISGSGNSSWMICVSAKPLNSEESRSKRTACYKELTEVSQYCDVSYAYSLSDNKSINYQKKMGGAETYRDHVQAQCNELDEAVQCGEWLVGVTCIAPDETTRDIIGGSFSAHMKEDVDDIKRPFPFEFFREERAEFMPNYQTVSKAASTQITSNELSMLCLLPVRDTCGFGSIERVDFDVHREITGNLPLGNIVNCGSDSELSYSIDIKSLNRHGLVIGLTGGGKTNTVKSLLYSFNSNNCPFLVIEPAKKEYYEMYNMGIEINVYTVGSDEGIPLYINPFEMVCVDGRRSSVQAHIDAVFAAFKASFIMYSPMPYVLENAIYSIYRDYGWNPETNTNIYGRNEYPTIEDLYFKIETVVDDMGYDERMRKDLIGSLKARINSLRVGSKGRTLNIAKSTDISMILRTNSVIELDDVNDEDAKAFIISLILLQIQECRKMQDTVQLDVRHILLIEEAHRLLRNVSSGTGENADPRGNAVEFFCNMLAELRSKGQGFMVIDQSPSKLAPDLIKNTNLKIVHRTVFEEDRHLVGSAMNMTDAQKKYLACLKQGYAAVYSEGDVHPKQVKFPYVKKYEKRSMSRSEILSEMRMRALVSNNNCYFSNLSEINAVCSHCRNCQNWCNPIETLKSVVKATNVDELMVKNGEIVDEYYFRIKKRFGSDDSVLVCAVAVWLDYNMNKKMNYSVYANNSSKLLNSLGEKIMRNGA